MTEAAVRWCAWCGDDLPPRSRRFCAPRCANWFHNDAYREKLRDRFVAGEELSDAQFAQISGVVIRRLGMQA